MITDMIADNILALLPAYRFVVLCNNNLMGFQSISGIGREIETETYQEGGFNTGVHVFYKGVSKEGVLSLEKGCYSGFSHPFYLVGEPVSSLRVEVLSPMGIPLKSYIFTGVFVRKWEIGSLNGGNNELLIDKFELSYAEVMTG